MIPRLALTVLVMLAVMLIALVILVPLMLPAHAADCGPRTKATTLLMDQYGETLRAAGESEAGLVEVYANSATRTWTILVTRPDMTACLLAAGQDWLAPERPMPRPKGEPT